MFNHNNNAAGILCAVWTFISAIWALGTVLLPVVKHPIKFSLQTTSSGVPSFNVRTFLSRTRNN